MNAPARPIEALRLAAKAVDRAPGDPGANHRLGALLTQMGRAAEGEAPLRAALAASGAPMVRHVLALNLLQQGQYAEGFALYRRRYDAAELGLPRLPAFAFPRWTGEDLAGKRLAIFPEGGLGDQIMFARFVPLLEAMGAGVTLLVSPPLERLLAETYPNAEVRAASGSVAFADPDYWTLSPDLAGDCGATLDALPRLALRAETAERPAGLRVGLKTAGAADFTNDVVRSLPAAEAKLLRERLPGTVVDLDPAVTGARDMAETAALMRTLDMVVTVDTSVAHLAGGLGLPVHILVPGFAADWRWLEKRRDSPWYPSATLHRGELAGGWRQAIRSVVEAVAKSA